MKKFMAILLLMITVLLLGNLNNHSQASVGEVQASMDQPKVLVLNAYHRGYGWTDFQTNAIIEKLQNHKTHPIYYIEYLDWKRQPSEVNLKLQSELLINKYKDEDIDVIIATDDIGMQFSIDYRSEIAPEAPIVFTGVFEETAKARMKGVENITGVYESIDPFGTMDMILKLHPNLNHVYVINDNSGTGKDVEKEIMVAVTYYAEKNNYTYERLNNHTYEEIELILSSAVENSVVIMGTHNIDVAGNKLPNEAFTMNLANSIEIPIYSPYEYLFGHGIVGGSLLSGTLQGDKAAEIALEILSGTKTSDIDEFTVKTVYPGIDHVYAEKYNLPVEKLGSSLTIINRPESVFELYRPYIIAAISIIMLLAFFVVLLSVNIKVRKRTQYELENKHKELFDIYEDLTASEEELKAQNDELLEQQEEIKFLAYSDKLTQLPNRNAVDVHLKNLIGDRGTRKTIIMIVDLDNFNYINTAYGHEVGDHLLREVGQAFKSLEKEGFFVGRIGGDEFFVTKAIYEYNDEQEAINKINKLFETPFKVDGDVIKVSKSSGYTIHPDDGRNFDELLTRTSMAKKKMKRRGKNMTSRFESSMSKQMSERILLTKALKTAVASKEMFMVYQPQYNLLNKKIVGFESLLRWESPVVGNIKPDHFIPLAEETGEIINIGFFVLEEGMKFLKKNEASLEEGFRLSINVSVLQLLRQDFISQVKDLLQLYHVAAEMLEFEITESVLIQSFEIINERLIQLKLMGITISLDDFGTGYSSLTYLEKLPITTLKIDKSFIDGIVLEGEKHFFSKSIIEIAHKMGLRVIAEGVEHQSQVDYLMACDSRIIQGYWYSKPISSEAAIQLYIENTKQDKT